MALSTSAACAYQNTPLWPGYLLVKMLLGEKECLVLPLEEEGFSYPYMILCTVTSSVGGSGEGVMCVTDDVTPGQWGHHPYTVDVVTKVTEESASDPPEVARYCNEHGQH